MADEEVSHAFSHGYRPDHSERLAAYWAEALGGPPLYSPRYGDETSVVRIHSGNGAHEEMDRRAIACFDRALADIGLAAEEVEKVTPLLTFRNGKGEIEGVRYNQLSAIFINAFREQQKEIELQHREITRLKKQVRRLRASSRPQRRDGDARNIRT